MLTIQNLKIKLLGETIIQNFSLTLNKGESACLYGPSGCGKTTILKAIAGLIDTDEGKIDNHFKHVAYLFQEHRLLPWRTALENVLIVLPKHIRPIEEAKELLLSLSLKEHDFDKYPHELSGGMKQRVSLARALITKPDLLLMDEPFSALDMELRMTLQQMILQKVAEKNMAIVLVTHDRFEAAKMAHKIYFLSGKPTTCDQIITLKKEALDRQHSDIERELHQSYWPYHDIN